MIVIALVACTICALWIVLVEGNDPHNERLP